MSQPCALLDSSWHACICATTPCCHVSCSDLSVTNNTIGQYGHEFCGAAQPGCAGAFRESMAQLAAAASSLLGIPPSGSTTLLRQPQTATTTRSSGNAAHATCTLVCHPEACYLPAGCILP